MLDDLLVRLPPPEKRCAACDGDVELHLTEGAIMVAYAMHLLETVPRADHVKIHPDGEHGKRFNIRACLKARGFELTEPRGSTEYGGVYRRERQTITVYPRSGQGDVSCTLQDGLIVAECKGGIINTKHAGQVSRLERGLFEAIGRLLMRPLTDRQIAVVPKTRRTEAVAMRLLPRTNQAGIEIALVDRDGRVVDVR